MGRNHSTAFAIPLQQIRDGVRRLYNALESVWACTRHASHSTNLKLDARLILSGMKAPKSDNVEAKICFSICSPLLLSSIDWQELDLPGCSASSASRSRVGFALPDDPIPSIDLDKLASVKCLCTVLEDTQTTKENLQFCLDHKDRLLYDSLSPRNSQAPAKSSFTSMVTLNELLATPDPSDTISRRRVFNRKQSYIIALNLASSFLQLYSTPFLNRGWCAHDILFPRSRVCPQLTHVEMPCISQNFPSVETPQGSQSMHDHHALLNLGILLLELFFREPFSEHREAAGEEADQSYANLENAMHWVKADKEGMPKGFCQAVFYCIMSFSIPDVDLADAAFQQKVVDNVIVPLRDELRVMGA